MSTLNEQKFEEIYKKTYQNVLKYILCKCQNLDDVNELLQDSYVELYKTIRKKHFFKVSDENSYMIGIARNVVNKYYRNKYRENSNILYLSNDTEEIDIQLKDDFNLETDIITKENISEIWDYLNKKNVLIAKIFYLYYGAGLKIIEISKVLSVNESTVKNYMYRTLKELKEIFGEEEK